MKKSCMTLAEKTGNLVADYLDAFCDVTTIVIPLSPENLPTDSLSLTVVP